MSSVTKKQKIIQEKLDPEKTYSITEAIEIIQSVKSEKFDESIDISVKLGVILINLIKMLEELLPYQIALVKK